jgi:hypothetical protein
MTVVVRNDLCEDPNYDGDWVKWLESVKSFRYECRHGNISVVRDGEYWTASKKVNGQLRRKRLGRSESVTIEKLTETAKTLCVNVFYKEHLERQSEKKRETARGVREYSENIKRRLKDSEVKINYLENRLREVSQKSRDTETVERVTAVLDEFDARDKSTRDWVQARKLINALRDVIEPGQ